MVGQNYGFPRASRGRSSVVADQSGSGKTLAYLLPLLQRHVLSADPEDTTLKLIAWVPKDDQRKGLVIPVTGA
jgi:superfamily II DNA/RNA helicase